MKKEYIAPVADDIKLYTEQFLCSSAESGEDKEEWSRPIM